MNVVIVLVILILAIRAGFRNALGTDDEGSVYTKDGH